MANRLSRRSFLGTLGSMASVSILAACQQQAPAPPKPAADAKPTTAAVVPPTAAPAQQQAPAVVPPTSAPAQPAAAAAPTAAPAAQPAAQASIKRGGELRIMQTNDFVSMDPIHASGPTAGGVYDSLFAWRPNAQGG